MSLPPLSPSNWADEIAQEAERWMNCTATFYDPVPGNPPTLTKLFEAKARWQHLRTPVDSSNATAWSTKRAGRIQVPLNAATGLVKRGLIVRLSPGVDPVTGALIPLRDPTLALISFTTQNAVNSSHAALRTIEVVTEVVPVPAVA